MSITEKQSQPKIEDRFRTIEHVPAIPKKKGIILANDFQYGHLKFIPKKQQYCATRKEFNNYKKAFFEQQLNDKALNVNQASIGFKFNIIEKETFDATQ